MRTLCYSFSMRVATVLFGFFLLSTAFAADREEWETRKTKTGTLKIKTKQVLEFEGSELDGKVKTPSGALISPRKKVKIDRLIRLRTDFDTEVEHSSAGTR